MRAQFAALTFAVAGLNASCYGPPPPGGAAREGAQPGIRVAGASSSAAASQTLAPPPEPSSAGSSTPTPAPTGARLEASATRGDAAPSLGANRSNSDLVSKNCPPGTAYVPGGRFKPLKRRSSAEVRGFCLDVTEVTVAAYRACVKEKKCSPECLMLGQCSAVPTQAEWSDPNESQRASKYCNGDRDDRQDHPVNCVSWEESSTYCEAYKKRLPSSVEWEWASRGASEARVYPWGNADVTTQLCWSRPNARAGTCPAGATSSDKSPQGVFDLAGNLSEWAGGEVAAPRGDARGPVRQAFGASWYAMDDGYVRAALGGVESPSERNETFGFRCAADAL